RQLHRRRAVTPLLQGVCCLDDSGWPTGQSRALSTGPQRLGCRVTRQPCPLTLVRVRLRPAVLAASESAVLFAERSCHYWRETNCLSAGASEEVDQQLVDALRLVVVHPVRCVGQALHAVEVGDVVVLGLREVGAEVGILLTPDDQCLSRQRTKLRCGFLLG